MKSHLAVAAALLLSGCSLFRSKPPQTIVAPTGQATQQAAAAVNQQQQATTTATAATTAALSQAAAAASNIGQFNQANPASPQKDGINGEVQNIKAVTGEPSAADKIAAAERARTVAEGNSATIAKMYEDSKATAAAAGQQLVDARAALEAANRKITATQMAASEEQKTLAAKFQGQIDKVQSDADARVQAAEDKAKKDERRLQFWIFVGGGAACISLGIFVIVFASSLPMFGPKAGGGLILAGLGLIATGKALDFIESHPWIVYTGLGLSAACAIAAIALIYANHHHAREALAAKAAPLLAAAETKATPVVDEARSEFDKFIAEFRNRFAKV